LYKSTAQQQQQHQSKLNDDASVPNTTHDELASRERAPSALQSSSAYPQPVSTDLFRRRSPPDFTAGLVKAPPASVGSVGVGRGSGSHVMVDDDDDDDYQHFRSTDGGTATIRQSVDGVVYQPSTSKDPLPHYLTQRQHSYPSANGLDIPATGTSSQSSSESVNDGVSVHNQMDFRAAPFARAGISDETARKYGIISGINIHCVINFVYSV